MKTIAISLWDGQRRDGGNARTVMRSSPPPIGEQFRAAARSLFAAGYAKFSRVCRQIEEPGIAIIAVDERSARPAGIATLCARVQRPVAAIVGRHDRCDLYLTGSAALALRQLAIVLGPVQSWEPGTPKVRYRILDLRTADGMLDEDGRPLRGLRAEGPSIVRCAGYALFVLPVGDPADWPASADDAWAMLPERVYFDELEHGPRGSAAGMPRVVDSNSRRTVITRTQGPLEAGMRLVDRSIDGGDVAGALAISGPHRSVRLEVGHDALRNGVLLGRYGRCDVSGDDDATLSRVHALLLHDDDKLFVIDTSSTHGTRIAGEEPARVIELGRELELQLGWETFLRWTWVA